MKGRTKSTKGQCVFVVPCGLLSGAKWVCVHTDKHTHAHAHLHYLNDDVTYSLLPAGIHGEVPGDQQPT